MSVVTHPAPMKTSEKSGKAIRQDWRKPMCAINDPAMDSPTIVPSGKASKASPSSESLKPSVDLISGILGIHCPMTEDSKKKTPKIASIDQRWVVMKNLPLNQWREAYLM